MRGGHDSSLTQIELRFGDDSRDQCSHQKETILTEIPRRSVRMRATWTTECHKNPQNFCCAASKESSSTNSGAQFLHRNGRACLSEHYSRQICIFINKYFSS